MTLFEELGPVRAVMCILALWPIYPAHRGLAKASMVSLTTCYTVVVYACWSVMNVRIFGERWHALTHATDFNDRVFNIILVAFLAWHWLVPFFIWPQTAVLARYFNSWGAFQAEWRELTGRPVMLHVQTRALLSAVGGVVFPALLLLVIVYTGQDGGITSRQAIVYFPTICFFFLTGAVWVTLCRAVETTADRLRQLYIQDVDAVWPAGQLALLRRYGRLWTRLQRLASEMGRAQSNTLVIYVVFSLVLALITAIGVVISLTHSDIGVSIIWLSLVMVESLHHIYTVHDAGHRAAMAVSCHLLINQVSGALRQDMLHLRVGPKGSSLDAEVRILLTSIAVHDGPSLGGFADCSRSGIIEVYNTLLINVLVLLQFAFSFS